MMLAQRGVRMDFMLVLKRLRRCSTVLAVDREEELISFDALRGLWNNGRYFLSYIDSLRWDHQALLCPFPHVTDHIGRVYSA